MPGYFTGTCELAAGAAQPAKVNFWGERLCDMHSTECTRACGGRCGKLVEAGVALADGPGGGRGGPMQQAGADMGQVCTV